MKLRIQDNSLRLRMNRKEVAALRERGVVECGIRFPGGRTLRYSVAVAESAGSVTAGFEGDALWVRLPAGAAVRWAESDQVTIEGADSGVQILVEKDFQCLHRPEDREPDNYPNPQATARR